MKFIIQHNSINVEDLHAIHKTLENYPHHYIGLIPFSREIVSEVELDGLDYIPYGSTLLTTLVATDLKWKGLFFDLDTFNYSASVKNRDDMLNNDLIISVKDAVEFLQQKENVGDWFIRPSHDLKQFSGQVIDSVECTEWLKDAMLCDSSGSYRLDADTPVVLAKPVNIQAEFRWFIVGGKVISGSLYLCRGQFRKERITDPELIAEAQQFADKWLPSPCCVMDLALVDNQLKVVEFNCINSSGFYDTDIDLILKELYNYCLNTL